MKILIGEISSYKAIVISKFISTYYSDYQIYTYDYKKNTKYFRTKYSVQHFIVDKPNYLQEIKDIINENQINYFFPVINENLSLFWQHKLYFNNSLDYLGDFTTFEQLNDKAVLYRIASSLDIKVPTKYKDVPSAKFPFVVKPTNLSSSKGVHYIRTNEEKKNLNFNGAYIVQEYIEGEGVGYSFYCKEGKIINGYGHKRLAEYPVTGGSSTYREEYKNEKMFEIASKVVRKINYTGFAMFEFKLTSNNELYLIEVNPRIWGSVNQGLVNGYNYFEEILGFVNLSSEKQNNFKTYNPPLTYLSFIKYILKFDFTPLSCFIKNIPKNKADVNFLNDPKGYISTILRKVL